MPTKTAVPPNVGNEDYVIKVNIMCNHNLEKILCRVTVFGILGIVFVIAVLRSYAKNDIDGILGSIACYFACILFHLGYWYEIERRGRKENRDEE